MVRHAAIFPASHYIVGPEKMKEGLAKIAVEMEQQVKKFTEEGKLLEAQRIRSAPTTIWKCCRRSASCKGIENYSAVFRAGRPAPPLHAAGLFSG